MLEIDLRKSIIHLVNSRTYQELEAYYSQKSVFHILGVARNENVHSNFLAWILNPNEIHNLGTYPMKKFLELLVIMEIDAPYTLSSKIPENIADAIISGNYDITDTKIIREKVVDYGRIDLLVDLKLSINNSEESLKIVLENKVYSKEHSDQTQIYYNWAKKQFQDTGHIIFVYLTPLSNLDLMSLPTQQCVCKQYIQINYQYLVNYLWEPCRKQNLQSEATVLLDNYLRCLSYPSIVGEDNEIYNVTGGAVMAISERERKLLLDFWENNKPLLLAMLNVLKDDENTDENDRANMQKMIEVISSKSSKDYSQYMFQNQQYGKSRLVLAVVTEYINTHPNITLSELKIVFSDSLQPSLGVVQEYSGIKDAKRYFTKSNEILALSSGQQIVVCNQWGKTNISAFIEAARLAGFRIDELTVD